MTDASSACERALIFAEKSCDEFATWRAQTLVAGRRPSSCPLPDGIVQRADGSLAASASPSGPSAASGSSDLGALLFVVGALDDVRGLHLPVVENACRFLEATQNEDGSWGDTGATEDEQIFWTGMLAGTFGKTRCARASMLGAAGDYLAERFTPDRVQGFAWHAIAAYTHTFANVPHEACDAILQWTGRELTRGFRTGRFDAVRTARVLLYGDAPALPGARLDASDVIGQLLSEQEEDGGWLRLEDPSPGSRLAHSLDALAALVRFG